MVDIHFSLNTPSYRKLNHMAGTATKYRNIQNFGFNIPVATTINFRTVRGLKPSCNIGSTMPPSCNTISRISLNFTTHQTDLVNHIGLNFTANQVDLKFNSHQYISFMRSLKLGLTVPLIKAANRLLISRTSFRSIIS